MKKKIMKHQLEKEAERKKLNRVKKVGRIETATQRKRRLEKKRMYRKNETAMQRKCRLENRRRKYHEDVAQLNKMPLTCAVVGCGSRGNRDSRSFYRIPRVPLKGSKEVIQMYKERREKWIEALKRDDLTDTKLKYARICNKHFINGYPATKFDSSNPDWIPSVEMGYIKENLSFDWCNRNKLCSEASVSTEVERRMHRVNNGRYCFRKKLKKSVVPSHPSLSSTDKLDIIQYRGAADSSDKQIKSDNVRRQKKRGQADHPTEVIEPLEQEVSINLAQEKEVTFEDLWNSEVLGHRCLNDDHLRAALRSKQMSDRRTTSSNLDTTSKNSKEDAPLPVISGKQMSERRTTNSNLDTTSKYSEEDVPFPVISGVISVKQVSDGRTTNSSPDTTCEYSKENVLFPAVDIKQEPQETLTTAQKMERALAITVKLALFMSESSFFHEHMTFLQSIYDSWASGPDKTCEYSKENVLFPVVDIKQEPQETLTTSQKIERALAITNKLALFLSESSFFHEHMAFLQSIYDSWARGKIALKIKEEAKEVQNKQF